MGRRHRQNTKEFETESYDDYEDYRDEMDDEFNEFSDLAKDFYSTDWEDPSGTEKRFSTRRKIERRNDMKELYSQFDDWDDYDISSEW